jgi:hypothetical protein
MENFKPMRLRAFCPIILFILAGLLLAACSTGSAGDSQTTYQISPSFREIYEKMGGEDVLGPAISEKFNLESFECQYTVNVLMCMNPQSASADRLFFYPLGSMMNVKEDPGQSPGQSGSAVIDGYTIYDEFLEFYDQIGGQFIGKPLTQAHINYSQQRIEQFFENAGFYRGFNEPTGSVHLLAYGAYNCESQCNYTPQGEASILNTTKASQDQPLLNGLAELVEPSILGVPLTQPYIAADGMEEQVYENAVVYAPVNNLSKVNLRPLSSLLNIPQSEPGARKYSTSDGMVFYATDGLRGYHVPLVFDDFIAAHGGLDYSGNPIGEVFQYSDTIYRQCFEKYCLDYNTAATDGSKVKLADLGKLYLQQISGGMESTNSLSPQSIQLSISEASKVITASDQQRIDILVAQSGGGQPVNAVAAELTVDLPDGTQMVATFPPTGLDGRSSVTIPAMKNITNGSIIQYRVCLVGIPGDPVCATGSYVIWSN